MLYRFSRSRKSTPSDVRRRTIRYSPCRWKRRHLVLVPQDVLAVYVGLDVAGELEPASVHERMRARTETEIFGQIPVFLVVARAEARVCEIRYSRNAQSRSCGAARTWRDRYPPARRRPAESGFRGPSACRLELQPVARQMLRPERQTLLHRVEELLLRLPGQAVHQVEADVGEAPLPREVRPRPSPAGTYGCGRWPSARRHARTAHRTTAG